MIGSFILHFCIVIATFFFALSCPRCDSVVVIHFVVACCPRPHMQFNLCTFNLFIIIMMVSLSYLTSTKKLFRHNGGTDYLMTSFYHQTFLPLFLTSSCVVNSQLYFICVI